MELPFENIFTKYKDFFSMEQDHFCKMAVELHQKKRKIPTEKLTILPTLFFLLSA